MSGLEAATLLSSPRRGRLIGGVPVGSGVGQPREPADAGVQAVGPHEVAGGLAVGLIALLADGLGADSQDVLFSGQAAIPDLIAESSTGIVLVLILAKAVAYGLSLAMFPRDLNVAGRRFALAETLAHAEHLRLLGALARTWQDGAWVYHA